MLALLQFNLPLLVVALLIGVVTGAWIVRSRSRGPASENSRPSEDQPT